MAIGKLLKKSDRKDINYSKQLELVEQIHVISSLDAPEKIKKQKINKIKNQIKQLKNNY